MARKNRKAMSKLEPAVETLVFDLGNVDVASTSPGSIPGHSTYFVDLSQSASLSNRKFFRQGLQWAVSGIRLNSYAVAPGTEFPQPGNAVGGVIVSKLPQNWVMSNSWMKSMRSWMRMTKEALSETPSVRPKFMDFKIYMDATHHQQGFGANKLPVTQTAFGKFGPGAFTEATPGEWIPSKISVPFGPASPGNTAEFEFVATGANFPGAGSSGLNAVSLIEGYAASRGLPYSPDPNTPADADDADGSTPENWMSAIFNKGTDQTSEVIQDNIFENNQAPYPFEGDGFAIDTMYPGGANQLTGNQLHCIEPITSSTVGGITYIKGGTFPCGFLRIDVYNTNSTLEMNNQLQIDLVPGSHRGYLAESMTEM
uniref:Uncharacterized protein n=1 Tax=uncultured marine virus TaxID=186617 RepID=S4TF14_9VIRU|nr:hypothetical protein [uncultured marine virus]